MCNVELPTANIAVGSLQPRSRTFEIKQLPCSAF